MIVVYIAGPYRAPHAWQRELNIREAEALAFEVWRRGMVALCPHTNTRHFDGALPDHMWLAGDLLLLDRCDAVLLTARWQESEGAKAEERYARQRFKPVFETVEALAAWAGQVVPGYGAGV